MNQKNHLNCFGSSKEPCITLIVLFLLLFLGSLEGAYLMKLN